MEQHSTSPERTLPIAVFKCIDIIEKRSFYRENHKNPLKKITSVILANAVDEKIEENGDTEK